MPTHTAYQTVALHRRAKDGDKGDNAVTYAIVFEQSVLTEGETGTMVYLDKTNGDTTPVRLTRTQMSAEGITLSGNGLTTGTDGTYYRIYIANGVVYGTEYTVIAMKGDTEIARATLGVTKKGDSTYLAQVAPASIEIQTDADGYPIIESDMVITHDAALDDKDITKFMPCPNKSLFGYEVFQSCNWHEKNTNSRMRIHFKGVSEIVFMYSSFAESKYDYIMLSNINTSLPATCISTNAAVKYHTNDKQTPGIVNEARYGNLNPDTEYFIDVMFRKDTSGDEDDDRGYIAIPVPTNSYTLTPSMQNATGNVTFDFDDSQLSLPSDCGLDYHKARPFIVKTAANVPVKQCELMLPVKDSGEGGTQLVRVPVSTFANGDTGNSLNWILWSAVRETQRTFHSKQSVGDTNIADIVIDDLSKDDNGIHTNLKYVCIRDFDHAPSSTDTPFDYSDKKEPRPDVVYFAQLDYLGNVATDLLVSDAVSTKILNAVNANIHNLDADKLTVRNVQAQSTDGNTTVIIDGKEGKLTAKNAEISGKLTATGGEIGGFAIQSDGISNTSQEWDKTSTVLLRNPGNTRVAAIGSSVYKQQFWGKSIPTIARFVNIDSSSSINAALVLDAQLATTQNFAILGAGNCALAGAVEGIALVPLTNTFNTMSLKYGNKYIITQGPLTGGNFDVYLPSISDIQSFFNTSGDGSLIGHTPTTYYAVRITVINRYNGGDVKIKGGDGKNSYSRPKLFNHDGNDVSTNGFSVNYADVMEFMITVTPQGDYECWITSFNW